MRYQNTDPKKIADVLLAFGIGSFLGIHCGEAMLWIYALGVTLFLSSAWPDDIIS